MAERKEFRDGRFFHKEGKAEGWGCPRVYKYLLKGAALQKQGAGLLVGGESLLVSGFLFLQLFPFLPLLVLRPLGSEFWSS